MKKIRLVISISLVICLAIGWVAAFSGNVSDIAKYNKNVKQARELVEKQLYQKAIASFTLALNYKEKESVRSEMLTAYDLGLEDGVITSNQYTAAYEESCELYPKNAGYWETLIGYYYENNSYSNAHEYYQKSVKASAKSEKLTELGDCILYSYTIKPVNYSSVYRAPNGYCTVEKYDLWGVVGPDGEMFAECSYEYVTPISSKMDLMYKTSRGERVYDKDTVLQFKLTEDFSQARAYGCGFIPVKIDDSAWRYYDCEQDCFVFDKYESASAFMNNLALVKLGGKWQVIDTSGKRFGDTSFDDVKLYDNGEYIYDGVMIAADESGYHMYDSEFKKINSFSASDMDNYYGGYIAYQAENGLWGYVNTKGDVAIEPQYKGAKSFSAGLAAISEEVNIEEASEDETVDISTTETATAESSSTVIADRKESASEKISVSENGNNELQETTRVSETETADGSTPAAANKASEAETKWGFIKSDGKKVIECNYYYAGYFSKDGYALVADLIGSYYFIALRFV